MVSSQEDTAYLLAETSSPEFSKSHDVDDSIPCSNLSPLKQVKVPENLWSGLEHVAAVA